MPLYDYDCAACGRRFEVIHGVHDPSPETCPLCGSGPVRKAFAAPAIVFKGSGWAKKERRSVATAGKKSTTDGAEKSEAGPTASDSRSGGESGSSGPSGSSGSSGSFGDSGSRPDAGRRGAGGSGDDSRSSSSTSRSSSTPSTSSSSDD